MNLFASSTLMWGKEIDEIGRIASKNNLKGVELWAEQAWFSKMKVRDIRRAIQRYNLDITFHAACWDLNICSLNEGIRQKSLEEITRSFALAASINATNVTVHPGRITLTSDWTMWHEEQLNKSLDILEEEAKTYGITMSIELMEGIKKEFVTAPELLNRLIENRSSVIQTTYDAAHISLDKSLIDNLSKLHRVNKIHLSDSSATRYHMALGEGELQLPQFIEKISEKSYPIVLEGYDTSEDTQLLKHHLLYLESCLVKSTEEVR